MKIAIILGTRPEIIKMSPIIRQCERRGLDYYILHTGQHYSFEMDSVFFDELNLPSARYNLDVGSGTHGRQTATMLSGIEEILMRDVPSVVFVQGDTNTVLAGTLAASKLHIKVGHVEAGLRSFDRVMPEETNRVIADHISDYLFAPTETSRRYLLDEGIPDNRIFVTGNTIVDAVYQNLEIAKDKVDVLERHGLVAGEYFLATAHRAENVDDRVRLAGILDGFRCVYEEFGMPIVFPAHPRTVKMISEFGFNVPSGTLVMEPLGYLEFLQFESSARLVLSDSGGLQEEACILGVGCVTLRDNTERPETVEACANMLVECDGWMIVDGVRKMIEKDGDWGNPYGDGKASERIVDIVINQGQFVPMNKIKGNQNELR